ncbi:MAG: ComF family protein [Lentisphaeria bacterium]|nr:ComF family protein [Candidatus Neomarinimicrobiota bacterium]MCF7842245.1 ComF family protein [Lentisphaeria bacterium]
MNRILNNLTTPLRSFPMGLIDLLYPPLCEICGEKLTAPTYLACDDCLGQVAFKGYFLEEFSIHGDVALDGAWCLTDFEPTMQHLVHLLKYSRRTRVVERLCDFWAPNIRECLKKMAYDRVAPIPLHPRKARERGYNQVAKLARWLGVHHQIPMTLDLLTRTRYTSTQTQLSAHERHSNVSGAFRINATVKGMNILLVDDVLTTGSTANACAAELKASGAKQVHLLTLSTPSQMDT